MNDLAKILVECLRDEAVDGNNMVQVLCTSLANRIEKKVAAAVWSTPKYSKPETSLVAAPAVNKDEPKKGITHEV